MNASSRACGHPVEPNTDVFEHSPVTELLVITGKLGMPWNTPAHMFIHIHNSILSFKYMTTPFTWSSQRYARCYGLIITSTRPFWGALTVCLSADRLAAHARADAEDQDAGETGRSAQSGAERVLKQHWKPHKRAPLGFSGSPCSAALGAASCRFLRHSCWGSRKRQKHAVVLLLLLLLKPSGGEVSDPCVSAVYSECEAGNLFCVNKKNY